MTTQPYLTFNALRRAQHATYEVRPMRLLIGLNVDLIPLDGGPVRRVHLPAGTDVNASARDLDNRAYESMFWARGEGGNLIKGWAPTLLLEAS
ncbi:hypothetical protein D3C74_247930 [compost metagenome]